MEGVKQVRTTPSWPRNWANLSPTELHSHGNARATSHLLGRPNTPLSLQLLGKGSERLGKVDIKKGALSGFRSAGTDDYERDQALLYGYGTR
jgi:hypothetical protein